MEILGGTVTEAQARSIQDEVLALADLWRLANDEQPDPGLPVALTVGNLRAYTYPRQAACLRECLSRMRARQRAADANLIQLAFGRASR
jgi:hypothetical protein